MLDVGEPVTTGQEDAVSPEHRDRQAGNPLADQLGTDVAVYGIERRDRLSDCGQEQE
jgi:hypothetical protein